MQSVADQKAVVTLSSDWDAGPLPPFGTLERALTRYNEPVQSLEEAIRMMTLNPAFLLHQEDSTGSIEAGKRADLVVIDRNLFEVPRTEISETKVLLTLLDGENDGLQQRRPSGRMSSRETRCCVSMQDDSRYRPATAWIPFSRGSSSDRASGRPRLDRVLREPSGKPASRRIELLQLSGTQVVASCPSGDVHYGCEVIASTSRKKASNSSPAA